MSCPHGNHPDACDICDEVAAAYRSGIEHTKRTWVGLTDEEATYLWESTDEKDGWELLKRVEAKLKELNT
jgi:hypothetical protein